jgi:hypothetical protein
MQRMQRKRRSGRIAKEIAIVLLGTDTTGKMLSEETKTVVLSRHGAGVVSRYRFSPDELLTLRLPDSTKEAEIRLVGQIGGEPGRYIYGVAFVDPDPHFWPMEFPEPESFESLSLQLLLECSLCQARQNVEQHEIEEDVYSVNGNILRLCEICGTSTPWRKAQDEGEPTPAPAPTKPSLVPPAPLLSSSCEAKHSKLVRASPASPPKPNSTAPPLSSALRTSQPTLGASAPLFRESFEPKLAASRAPSLNMQESPYSAASTISEFASLADIQTSAVAAAATAVLQAPEPRIARPGPQAARPASKPDDIPRRELDANGRPISKRRHVRIRVSFSACVRHPAHADEVVECENVSKGGVCFHSLQQYPLDSVMEVAAPFSPGEMTLFVPARIKRVEPLSGGKVFRYGVEYIKPASAGPAS